MCIRDRKWTCPRTKNPAPSHPGTSPHSPRAPARLGTRCIDLRLAFQTSAYESRSPSGCQPTSAAPGQAAPGRLLAGVTLFRLCAQSLPHLTDARPIREVARGATRPTTRRRVLTQGHRRAQHMSRGDRRELSLGFVRTCCGTCGDNNLPPAARGPPAAPHPRPSAGSCTADSSSSPLHERRQRPRRHSQGSASLGSVSVTQPGPKDRP